MSDKTSPIDDPKDTQHQRRRVDERLARVPVEARGAVTLADGRHLDYRVCTRFVPVLDSALGKLAGEPQAAIFTIAYLADGLAAASNTAAAPGGAEPPSRPVCFVFNGGPGSSSVWLHLGGVGPQRVATPDDGSPPPTPYRLDNNPHTWLAHFDLVFIDPPHTGWSITADAKSQKAMLSVDGDVAALAEVVRGWLAANGRFGAPLYLAGESYGTTRAAALADALLDSGLGLDGVVLVSCAMDLQSLVFSPCNDLPHALFLPAFANVAQYHGRLQGALGASPGAARAAAEAFVADDYLAALHAGARLSGDARSRIEARLAELTGLPRALVQQKNLRIGDETFFAELLRAQGQQIGRLDARCTAPLPARQSHAADFDPGTEAVAAPYTTTLLAYFQRLGLPTHEPYAVLSMEVNRAWRWQRKPPGDDTSGDLPGFTSTSADLARALRRQPQMRVLVASGRYDLGTPYSASDWSLAQLDAPPEVLRRLTHRYYDAGHMMYTRQADMVQLQVDLAAWLAAPLPAA